MRSRSWALSKTRADGSALLGIVRTRGCAPLGGLDQSQRQGVPSASCVCTMIKRHGVFALFLFDEIERQSGMGCRAGAPLPPQPFPTLHPLRAITINASPSVTQMSRDLSTLFTCFSSFEELATNLGTCIAPFTFTAPLGAVRFHCLASGHFKHVDNL